MQIAFTALLALLVVTATVWFVLVGAAQVRRTRALTGKAHTRGLHFAADDPFDVPRRYRNFALMQCGHSGHAENVTYGRVGGYPLRAFDFRYEAGHGTRRSARHYSVIVLEADVPLPSVAMWNDRDAQAAPLPLLARSRRVGRWLCAGGEGLVERLAAAAAELAEDGASVQTCGSVLLVCVPVRRGSRHYTDRLDLAPALLAALQALPVQAEGAISPEGAR